MMGLSLVKRVSKSWSLSPCGCSLAGCSFIRSTTLRTRTFSSGRCLRSNSTAARVSSVGTSPLDMADGQVVRGPPVGVHLAQLLGREWACRRGLASIGALALQLGDCGCHESFLYVQVLWRGSRLLPGGRHSPGSFTSLRVYGFLARRTYLLPVEAIRDQVAHHGEHHRS